ncbi:MAG TPA: tRNA (uridine(34)/cytosine(34)/5-carboxymethylaminomethyluridine(34)-2'-O)-methyltransferase TrmL [Halothiobacillus sp.]|nr:tRNA (uridine(34)/cytosine(34)/5-carboxymethylaminomethyluridine(34)-2'-O)-methyltransferase TrmL [Halothiobacillus sp.]
MLHIILYQPEIPPNTGNIIRLCANTGAWLHLVEPLGFTMEDKALRRAGLDYHEYAQVRIWPNLDQCLKALPDSRVFAFSTRGSQRYDQVSYRQGDALLFGPETRGLPTAVLEEIPPQRRLRLPMKAGSRSLNLSNSVAVALYEAWRQLDFMGADA